MVNSEVFPRHDAFAQLSATMANALNYFYISDNAVSEINTATIQSSAYRLIFESYKSQGNPNAILMQKYISQIDDIEIRQGYLDLSNNTLSRSQFGQEQKQEISKKNNAITTILRSNVIKTIPEELLVLIKKSLATTNVSQDDVLEIYAQNNDFFQAVLTYCYVLNTLCSSQALLCFAYQLKVNVDFLVVLEFLVRHHEQIDVLGNELDEGTSAIVNRLLARFTNIFIGNLTAKVFNENNYSEVSRMLRETGVMV